MSAGGIACRTAPTGATPRIGAGGVCWRCLLAVSLGGVGWRSPLAVSVGGVSWRSQLAESLGGPPQLGPPPRLEPPRNCPLRRDRETIVPNSPLPVGGVGWRSRLAESVGGVSWRSQLAESVGGVSWRCQLAVSIGGPGYIQGDSALTHFLRNACRRGRPPLFELPSRLRCLAAGLGGRAWRPGLAESAGGVCWRCLLAVSVGGVCWRPTPVGAPPRLGPAVSADGVSWRCPLAKSVGGPGYSHGDSALTHFLRTACRRSRPPFFELPSRLRCLAESAGGVGWRSRLSDRTSWGHPPNWGWRCLLAVSLGGVGWRCLLAVSVGGVAWRTAPVGATPQIGAGEELSAQAGPRNDRAQLAPPSWRSGLAEPLGGVPWRSPLAESVGGVGWRTSVGPIPSSIRPHGLKRCFLGR